MSDWKTAPTRQSAAAEPEPAHEHGAHARVRDIRRTLVLTALLLAVLAVAATVAVYFVREALPATVLAWAAVALGSAAAVLGLVMAAIGPRRRLAVIAVVIGLLANPLVLSSLVSAAGDLAPR